MHTSTVPKIAIHFNWTVQTVRGVLHKWHKLGLEGLWELPGRGVKPKLKEDDILFLEECLRNEPRTYNSRQLTEKLERNPLGARGQIGYLETREKKSQRKTRPGSASK